MKPNPKCCGKPMEPAFSSRVWARSRDDDDCEIEVESSVWRCATCETSKARPEKWRRG